MENIVVENAREKEAEVSRNILYDCIMEEYEKTFRLMSLYDEMPHRYGESVLYQTESHIVELIGRYPGITATEISDILKKTTSACSQVIRKLKDKGFVYQERSTENNRIYNLYLTEDGWKLYNAHDIVDKECDRRKKEKLLFYSETDLKNFLEIQRLINEEFEIDVKQSENIIDVAKKISKIVE